MRGDARARGQRTVTTHLQMRRRRTTLPVHAHQPAGPRRKEASPVPTVRVKLRVVVARDADDRGGGVRGGAVQGRVCGA
jgi:hypothetical protein